MAKNAGNYYKLRTKKWLKAKGFEVATMERMLRISKDDKVIFIKQDQMASDLLAVSEEQIIFIQVKLNRKHIAEGVKGLAAFKMPKWVDKWVVVWSRGAREPEVIEVE